MKGFLACFLITMCSLACAQPIYQCPGADGRKVFQQAPCTDGTRLNVKPTPQMGGTLLGNPEQHRQAVAAESRNAAIDKRDEEVRIAIQQRRPMVGMTEAELLAALGQPDTTNVGLYNNASRLTKQWVYRAKGGNDRYVYTENGVVTSMQWSLGRSPEPKLKVYQ